MKTLHFNKAGEYTGYSVNQSSFTERVSGALVGLALAGAGAAVSYLVGNIWMPQMVEKYYRRKQAAEAEQQSNKEFEDPK